MCRSFCVCEGEQVPRYVRVFSLCMMIKCMCECICQLSNYFGYLSLQLARVCTMLMVFSFLFLRDLKTPQTVLFAMIFHSL